ncbi:Sel1 domain protein repeat-containing protein [Seminavis robusta]|uniref:Sel1 domain protein repeat-containing protein n=1 Tax=Seminavis robusta TaxID=568900 RepID=A0A9N8ER71_9STRA|nr:Sel1 domain protein repeat-containing protein [Seminavis robusta]|eukprot:Sro1724_g293710.1 Sel1 domain protein repeat-containing protein (186) ;mRNA; r:14263-15938
MTAVTNQAAATATESATGTNLDAVEEEAKEEKAKTQGEKTRQSAMSFADDLICPISLELPWEPVKQDDKLAFQWVEKAHFAGSVIATGAMGLYYLEGTGVEKCLDLGIMYLTMAAGQGSDWAAYALGVTFSNGSHGVVVNKSVAILWLEKALGECTHQDLTDDMKKDGEKLLNELKANDISSINP